MSKGDPKSLGYHDLIDELSQLSPPENVRQAVTETLAVAARLAKTHGAEPRAVAESASSTDAVNSGTASSTDQTPLKVLKPGTTAAVPPLSTIRPTLKDLVSYAVPRVAPAWYNVGLQLDIEPDVLDEIEEKRSDHSRRMFAKWLKGSPCSWQSVLNAVEKVRGAKPMEGIRAAVVESIKPAQSSEAGEAPVQDTSRVGVQENELLREALKQAKSVLCVRLPIESLPTVLESKGVISFDECEHIRQEANSVNKSIKLLDQVGRKPISIIRQFLDILKFAEGKEIVEKDFDRLVEEKTRSARETPPRRGISSNAYRTNQPTQSPEQQTTYVQPSMELSSGSTNWHVLPMPVDLQVISSILLENKVYVTGIATDYASQCVMVYSLDEGRWFTLKAAPNYNAPMAVISGHVTLVGGRESEENLTNVLYSWFEEGGEWKQIVPPMPIARLESGVRYHDGLLLVVGGIVDVNQKKPINTVVVYNFTTERWRTPEALDLPKGLRSPHVVIFKEYVYLIGGAITFPARPEEGEKQFNFEAWRAQWRDIKEAVNEAEEDVHTAAGRDPSKKVTSVWRSIAHSPVVRPTAVSCKNSLMLVGGAKGGTPQKGIYEFIEGKNDDGKVDSCGSWELVGSMSVGRYRHAAVPVGNRGATLFVAGGCVQGDWVQDERHEKTTSAEFVAL